MPPKNKKNQNKQKSTTTSSSDEIPEEVLSYLNDFTGSFEEFCDFATPFLAENQNPQEMLQSLWSKSHGGKEPNSVASPTQESKNEN